MNKLQAAATNNALTGELFGVLVLVLFGLLLYWIVWFLIKKYLLIPLIKKSSVNETIEKDKAGES